jgi:hypothetical protein
MIQEIEEATNKKELLEYVYKFCGTLAITHDIPDESWFERVCEQYVKIRNNSNAIPSYIIEPLEVKFIHR